MSLIQLIQRVLGIHNERCMRPVVIPVVEGMEGRRMMAFTGGVRVGVADVGGDNAGVADGTSNTILYAENYAGSNTGTFFLRNTNTSDAKQPQPYLQYKLENVLITSYQL